MLAMTDKHSIGVSVAIGRRVIPAFINLGPMSINWGLSAPKCRKPGHLAGFSRGLRVSQCSFDCTVLIASSIRDPALAALIFLAMTSDAAEIAMVAASSRTCFTARCSAEAIWS